MKRKNAVLLCAMATALFLLTWNFVPRVSSHGRAAAKGATQDKPQQDRSGDQSALAEKAVKKMLEAYSKRDGDVITTSLINDRNSASPDGDDPDLPSWMAGKIDKEAYLRLRADYIDMLRGGPRDPAAADAREAAIKQMVRQEKAQATQLGHLGLDALSSSTTWTPIGPAPIPNGQTSNVSVPVSGRTIAIAVHPTNPDIVYVGTAQGGLYKSTDGGANWTALFEFQLESLAIGALTIDPTNSDIVYVGTGETNQSADSFAGRGLYIIRNANSASPTLTGPFRLDGLGNDVFSLRSIGRILVNPSDNNIIFVSTTNGTGGNPNTGVANPPNRGIYRSTNAQSASPTFEQVPITGFPTPYDRSVVDMVMEPGNPNLLIATIIGATGDGGIYRTANALDPAPTFARTRTLPDGATNGRAELDINKNGSVVTVYAATGETSSAALGGPACAATRSGLVTRSTDGGLTWSTPLPGSTGFCGGQCFYDIAIAATPDNQTIHLGGAARGGAGQCLIEVMKRSTNGGTSFARNDNSLHADEHALAIAPSNPSVVYTGSDGGIWRSTDNGNTWTSRNTMSYSATQFQSIAVHPFDRNFTIGGTQDNGTNCLAPDGVTWFNCRGGDGGYALIDTNAQDTTNVTMYHTFFNQTNSQIGFERADNTGFAWTFRGCSGTVGNNGIGCGNAVLFYAPMAQGPGSPNTIYFGTDRLYRSTNRGDTMTLASQGPLVPVNATQGVVLTTIGISPQDDNVRIVGLRNGQVFATTTGSATLTDVTGANFPAPNPLDPARKSIGRAVIDPNNKFTAYITFTSFGVPAGQHIFKTTDLNSATPTWTASGNGIPDVPVDVLVVDPQDSNSLYAGTDIGVYHSSDGGANWSPFGTGLPRVAVFDMKISNVQRILRIATHGRGMYEIDIPGDKLPVVRNGGSNLVYEGCAPGNGAIDPGEDVTVSFGISNIGAGPTNNLVVSLLPTGGVTPYNSPQNYGAIQPGTTVFKDFNLTASGNCGDTITLTFHLQDGDTDLGNLTVQYTLGALVTGAPSFSENFDGVTAPALPSGWTTGQTGGAPAWVTTTSPNDTAPNSAYGAGAAVPGSNNLDSPVIAIPTAPMVGVNAGVQLSFRNNYNTEGGFDGGVLEISINGGPFTDILAAGGSFETGGYNAAIGVTDNVLTGRQAWTGTSNGFITTKVNLPATAFGQNAQFRWRTAYDTGTNPANGGMRVDTISIYTVTRVCCQGACMLSCPSNIEVPNDAGQCGAIVNYPAPTYTGNCGMVTVSQASGTFFPVGTTTVNVTGTRFDGSTDSCSFTVTVKDMTPPVVSNPTVDKPMLWPPNHTMRDVTVSYTATDDCPSNCVLSVTSNEPINGLGDGDTAPDWVIVDNHHVQLRAERASTGDGRIYTITVTCTDSSGNQTVKTTTVRVAHNISGPGSGAAFKINTPVSFSGTFWDVAGKRHTAQWVFDSLTTTGTVTEPTSSKAGIVKGTYTFTTPGVYKVTMKVTDNTGVTTSVSTTGDLEAIVVIYDPNGSYTIGGGWLTAPAGSYRANPSLTGKLAFGFNSKYTNAANPKGETEIKFNLGNFEFNALNYDYLSVSGSKAQFKGFGKVNGDAGYNFILTVIDGQVSGGGGVDKFRIKVWNKTTGVVVFDTQMGASDAASPTLAVGTGSSIVIQK